MTKSYTLGNDLRDKLIGKEIIGEGGFKSVFVPLDTSIKMIELLENSEINYFEQEGILTKRFLDIYCTSGSFLYRIVDRLLNSKQYDLEFKATEKSNKLKHILENNIFAVCPDLMTNLITCRELFGDALLDAPNILYISHTGQCTGKPPEAHEIHSKITEMMKLGGYGTVEFDVVIGNPPYNRGMDIDFVFTGFDLAKDYVIMITPAKWQTAEDDQGIASNNSYGQFRSDLVLHMKELVYYPDCYDLFDIKEASGITYYILDKHNIFDKCTVVNISALQDKLNSKEERSITNGETLWNIGNAVINSMGKYDKLNIEALMSNNTESRYFVNSNNQSTKGGGGFLTKELNEDGKWVTKQNIIGGGGMLFNLKSKDIPVITKIQVIDRQNYMDASKIATASSNLYYSNSYEACESFVSFMTTKLVRFLILVNFSKQTLFDNNTFKFVPMPMALNEFGDRVAGKFDHIYTDEELYKTFNIPQECIDVIESVIKKRKK